MPTITYIEHNGTEHQIEAEAGATLMQTALDNGALGGKISGAGGGGFFTFYCNKNHDTLRSAMASKGLKELDYSFDFDGSKIISNHR